MNNLWDTHPPFQIDGNFGGTAGITEMLLQSHMGFIQLLPALPDAWKNGAVEGLCAKGNFEVDITWENGSLKEATILSKAGAPCHVRYGNKTLTFKTSKGKTYKIAMENGELKTSVNPSFHTYVRVSSRGRMYNSMHTSAFFIPENRPFIYPLPYSWQSPFPVREARKDRAYDPGRNIPD